MDDFLPSYLVCSDDIKYLISEFLIKHPTYKIDYLFSDVRGLEFIVYDGNVEIVNINSLCDRVVTELKSNVGYLLRSNDIIHFIEVTQGSIGLHKTIKLEIKV